MLTGGNIEAAHHKIKQFFDAHPNYCHNDKDTEEYGVVLLKVIIHFNSNNLDSVELMNDLEEINYTYSEFVILIFTTNNLFGSGVECYGSDQ